MTSSSLVQQNNAYQYSPLEQRAGSIRVLRVASYQTEPGKLKCELQSTTIVECAYSALSYTWDHEYSTGEELDPVEINGRPLQLRRNLLGFIDLVSKTSIAGQNLWVDAICINQDDIEERSQQVQQMGNIYKSAERVYVWLGRTYRQMYLLMLLIAKTTSMNDEWCEKMARFLHLWTREELIDILLKVCEARRFEHAPLRLRKGLDLNPESLDGTTSQFWKCLSRDCIHRHGLAASVFPEICRATMLSFVQGLEADVITRCLALDFSERFDGTIIQLLGYKDLAESAASMPQSRYWSRLWIVQELLLAKDILIVCGDIAVRWDDIMRPCNELFNARRAVREAAFGTTMQTLYDHRQLRKESRPALSTNSHPDIIPFTRRYPKAGCKDIRDKIFGFLSLADPDGKFIVNYKDSRTIVACKVAAYFPCTTQMFESIVLLLSIPPEEVIELLSDWLNPLIAHDQPQCQDCDAALLDMAASAQAWLRRQSAHVLCLGRFIPPGVSQKPRHIYVIVAQTHSNTRSYLGRKYLYGPFETNGDRPWTLANRGTVSRNC